MRAQLALVSLVIVIGSIAYAEEDERKSLAELPGVLVVVEDIRPEVRALGLTSEDFKSKVEIELRKARIRVLEREEYFATTQRPYLYVNFNATVIEQPHALVFNLSCDLNQTVTLTNGHSMQASTWHASKMGIIDVEDAQSIRSDLVLQIEGFANDFLAANPNPSEHHKSGLEIEPNTLGVPSVRNSMTYVQLRRGNMSRSVVSEGVNKGLHCIRYDCGNGFARKTDQTSCSSFGRVFGFPAQASQPPNAFIAFYVDRRA